MISLLSGVNEIKIKRLKFTLIKKKNAAKDFKANHVFVYE